MDSRKRRAGRPKTPPRTGPLVLENDRSRETVEVQLNSETTRELAEYAAWVELSSSLTTTDATFRTVDYALREVFRRDRVWQEHRRASTRTRPGAPPTAAPPSPALSPSPSPPTLPPPLRDPNRPVTAIPTASRQ
jgi:hypothetical protein